MMATDSERREAAARLREKSRKYARELSSSHTSINAYHEVREVLYGADGAPKSLCEFFDRLADLIDPCDTSLSCRDTVAYDLVEPGTKLYDSPNSSNKEARGEHVVDREALLALADEMSMDGMDGLLIPMSEYARRIREACGEVVE